MRARGEQGYTLTELVVTISIMAIIAAIAAPGLSGNDESKLEIAAADVASAIRFAHSEAVRTGEVYGVFANTDNQRIQIFRLPASTPILDVYDPLTKRLLGFGFGNDTNEVSLTGVNFTFYGLAGSKDYVGFAGGSGTPKHNGGGTVRLLNTAKIRLSYDDAQRIIEISPITGRVTVQ